MTPIGRGDMFEESAQDDSPMAVDERPEGETPDAATQPESSPEAAAADAVESPADSTDAPESGQAPVSVDPNAAPPADAPPAVPEPSPLRVRYFGRDGDDPEFALDGAVRHHDGRIEIPPQAAGRAMQLLGRGREYERVAVPKLQQLEREVHERTHAFNEDAARGNALWQFITGLAQQPPEVQQAWWQDFTNNKPLLDAAVERELARQQYDAARKLREPSPDQQTAQQQAQVEQAQSNFWLMLQSQRTAVPALTDDQLAEIADELWDDRQAFLVTSPIDDPARGLVKGQAAWNVDKIAKRLSKEATYRSTPATSPSPASPKALQNAKVVQAASAPSAPLPQATPPAPARSSPTSQPRNADGTFKTKDDYEREMANKYRF